MPSIEDPTKNRSNQQLTSLAARGSRPQLNGSRGLRGSRSLIGSRAQMNQNPDSQRTFENTFKTKPDRKFRSEPIQRLIDATLKKHLASVVYNSELCAELTKTISNEILAGVKQMNFDRYKFVVDVTINENKGQGIRIASRCLWDTSVDSCASASFKSGTLFATGIVFGCYFE